MSFVCLQPPSLLLPALTDAASQHNENAINFFQQFLFASPKSKRTPTPTPRQLQLWLRSWCCCNIMTPAVCPVSPVGPVKKMLMFIVRHFLWRRRNDCSNTSSSRSSRGSITGFSNASILCALSWAAIRIKWGNQLFALIKIYRHTARQIERQPWLQIQLQIHLQIQKEKHRVSEWERKAESFICPVTSSTCIASLGFVLFYFLAFNCVPRCRRPD